MIFYRRTKPVIRFEEKNNGKDLVSRFDDALRSGRNTKRLDKKYLGLEDNLPGQVKYALTEISLALEQEEPTSYNGKRIREAVDRGYIGIFPELRLQPISGLDILIHYGALLSKEGTTEPNFDNLFNLRRFGVFGNPSSESAIYLQKPNSDITQNSNYWCEKDYPFRVDLELDAEIIGHVKPIYVDPETILPNPWYDTLANLGQSYFILGGIPREAIISYRMPNWPTANHSR